MDERTYSREMIFTLFLAYMEDASQSNHEDPATIAFAPGCPSAMLTTGLAPQGPGATRVSELDSKLTTVRNKSGQGAESIEMDSLKLLAQGVIDDLVRRVQSQPNMSAKLCWIDKLAELKADFPQDMCERLVRSMKIGPLESPPGACSRRPNPTPYSYSSLRVEPRKRTFRLLILMPAVEKNSAIKCTLAQEFIENEPKYEALSYVWSLVPGSSEVEVNDRPFLATKNLEAALRNLRFSKKRRVLWVDAICINQNDSLEKQSQVQMMGEIYSKAANVLMWLGNETNATLKAFKFLEWVTRSFRPPYGHPPVEYEMDSTDFDARARYVSLGSIVLERMQQLAKSKQLDHDLEGVATILRNPYWRRIWIVQEVVLARSATVICGTFSMDWDVFSYGVERIWLLCESLSKERPWTPMWPKRPKGLIVHTPVQKGDDSPWDHILSLIPWSLTDKLMSIEHLREQRLQGTPLKVPALLAATIDHESTDARDKIYGLLGMATMSDLNTPIIADYTIAYPELCTRLAKNLLLSSMSLDLLQDLDNPVVRVMRKMPPRQIHLPSWVPNFAELRSMRSVGDSESWKLQAILQSQQALLVKDSDKTNKLALYPRVFNASAHSPQCQYSFSADFKIFSLPGIEFDVVEKVGWLFSNAISMSRRFCLRNWQELIRDILYNEYPRGGITYQEAYWRTTFCDIILPEEAPTGWELPSTIFDTHIPPTTEAEEQRLIDLAFKWSSGGSRSGNMEQELYKTLFLTRSGLLGLGPANILSGDTLAVLMGGRKPIVLRRTIDCHQLDKSEDWIYHRVIGESYVHGVMQGEVVQEQKNGAFKLEDFHLV